MSQQRCLEYLKEYKTGTAREIAETLGLTVRDAQRCLKKLKDWNYPVDYTVERIYGKRVNTYVWHYLG